MEILGVSNKRIKLISSLKRKSGRQKEGMVFLEGERLIRDSARYGAAILSVFYSEDYTGERIDCTESFILPRKVFAGVAETVTPQGICAVAKMPRSEFPSPESIASTLTVLCDNVRDPGNLGAIIRSAHAFGAGALFLTEGCADPYGMKCIRSSMGSIFALPSVCRVDENNISELKKSGWRMAAGILDDNCTDITKTDIRGKFIIAVGSEANGVGDTVRKLTDSAVIIPMMYGAESFNAAVAASIMMYEHYRQNH